MPSLLRRTRVASLGALPILMAALMVSSPVLAASDCEPTAAAFGPGSWVARGIQILKTDRDDRSVVMVEGEGGFNLTISATGDASGSFSLAGSGMAKSYLDGDDSGLTVDWTTTGKLSGTGTVVKADGMRDLAFSGVIDSNPNGEGDAWSGTGNEHWGFGNNTSIEYHGTFSPSAANCNRVFGSLGGPVAFNTDTSGGESYFMAVKVGQSPDSIDVESQLIELLDRAEEVFAMDPIDTDILKRFVDDMLAFDALLVSLEYCDAIEANVGPIWSMLRSVLIHTATRFLDAALSGAYSTRDVIVTMATILQGGTLAWRGPDCIEPTDDEAASGIFVLFEDVLLQRLEDAWNMPVLKARDAEVALIAAAAYQFGLPRVIAALEGN